MDKLTKNVFFLAFLSCFVAFCLLLGATWPFLIRLNGHWLSGGALLLCFGSLMLAAWGWRQTTQTTQWQRLAHQDALTALLNRRGFDAQPLPERYCCVLIDINNFKSINDNNGHTVGDQWLVHVARRLQHTTRQHDLCIRWGGDEFLVVLADADQQGAQHFIKRLHKDLEEHAHLYRVTVTAGWADNHITKDKHSVIQHADKHLLANKQKDKKRFSS